MASTAMANLSNLPTELVLRIARRMRSHDSPKTRADALAALFDRNDRNEASVVNLRLQKQRLRFEQTSLLSLSSTCRAFRSIVAPEAYYFISNVTMKGSWPPVQLFSMLQLLEERPDIRGCVKQVHLAMPPSTYFFEELTPGQIQSLWEQVESKYGVKILDREEGRHDAARSTDEMGYGILLAKLLSVLRGVEGLSVFSTAGTFAHAGNYLARTSTILTEDNHQKKNAYAQDMSPAKILPNLTSLAVTNEQYDDVELQPNITTWSSMAVLDVCPHLSKVWADGFYDSPPIGNLPKDVCQNITALNLMNTFISEEAFPALMKRINCLETFKFLVVMPDCGSLLDDGDYRVLSSRAAIRGLECHSRSLRTFYYLNNFDKFDQDELFDTFEVFESLENLWIDRPSITTRGGMTGYVYSVSGDTPDREQDHGPQSLPCLPNSLRRLYISEDIKPILDSLRSLASGCKLRFPKLEKVVFGEPYLLRGSALDEMGINDIYRKFRNAGVEACLHDKTQLSSW